MNSALLGLVAALSWGVYDFLVALPLARRRPDPYGSCRHLLRPSRCSAPGCVLGGDGITIVWPKLWLVAVAGIFFTLATLALFAAFALGPISIVAPIAGSYPALAMIFAVAQGARPSAAQWLAIAGVMAGVVIVSRSGGRFEDSGELSRAS